MEKRPQRRTATPTDEVFTPPAKMRKLGEGLFEQQMWCWGCDVRRETGNLFLAYGLEKHPSPEPRYHSAYTYMLASDSALTLWGWGLWIAIQDYGSAFISRSSFRVRYCDKAELQPVAWCEAQLPPPSMPQQESGRHTSAHLLATAFCWIAAYERWLADQVESGYRERALAAWPQRRRYRGGIPTHEVADHWIQLAQMAASITPV